MLRSPRAFNAALYAFQFVVRYLRRPQFVSLISPAYRSRDRYLCNNAMNLRFMVVQKASYIQLFDTANDHLKNNIEFEGRTGAITLSDRLTTPQIRSTFR